MRLNRSLLLAAALLVVALGSGCRAMPPASTGGWRLALATTPADPAVLGDTQFQLRLSTVAGAPVEGATVTVDLVMATMDMGPNRVALRPQAPGVYVGAGHFTMAGDWNCTVTVALGDRSQTQVFHYKVS